jgi:hypothetical protein
VVLVDSIDPHQFRLVAVNWCAQADLVVRGLIGLWCSRCSSHLSWSGALHVVYNGPFGGATGAVKQSRPVNHACYEQDQPQILRSK